MVCSVCMLHVHVQCPYACVFRFRSCACACSHGAYSLVFLSHTARQTLRQCLHARNKKRLASRLARSVRSQPVINKGLNTPNVTRSPAIEIAKLSEVFINTGLFRQFGTKNQSFKRKYVPRCHNGK